MENYEHNSPDQTRLNGLIFFAICGVLSLTVIAFGAVDTWALAFLSVTIAGLLIAWGADSLLNREVVFSLNPLQLPIVGLIFIGLIQLLPLSSATNLNLAVQPVNSLSIAPYSTRIAVIQLCTYLAFFALAFIVMDSEKRIRRLVYLIIIFGTIMSFFGILQYLASSDGFIYGLREAVQASPYGPFVNSHHFAAFMEMTIALPLALLFGNATKKDKRALLIVAALVMGMSILFTSSRGGFLGLLGVVGFVIVSNVLINRNREKGSTEPRGINFRKNAGLFGGGIALILVIVGIALFLTDNSTIDRVANMQAGSQEITNGRGHFWKIALQIFKDHPIIGSGLESFGTAFPFYDSWNGSFRLEYAHNDYLQTLSDTGILGFLCIASFIYLLFRRSIRVIAEAETRFLKNASIGALAGCFGILIHSFFDFPLRTPSNSYFFLIFAVLATTSVGSTKIKRRMRSSERI
jgi:O-antigen ligase